MAIRFIHAADIHLGYRQYGNADRYNDFAHAFECLVDDALGRRVDFVLLAGDLFHKRVIQPRTLLQATHCLERLRDGGIPVIAIEGNHDSTVLKKEKFSWLDYLVEADLLILLNPSITEEGATLDPWDGHDKVGAYIDLKGVRVMGLKYYGAMTPGLIQDLSEALANQTGPRPPYTILMLHAGLQGILDHYSGTLTRAQLDSLRPYVDYLALGHIHKPFIQDDWIYNPGSLETNSVDEAQWEDRGYFVVEVDPANKPAHSVTRIRGQRRRFVQLSFSVDGQETPEALYTHLEQYLQKKAEADRIDDQPVIELRLLGILAFDRVDLDTTRIAEIAIAAFHPLLCNVKDLTTASEFEIRGSEEMSREELEEHVLRELVERDARWRGDSERWARMILSLKRMALSNREPEEIVADLCVFCQEMLEEGASC